MEAASTYRAVQVVSRGRLELTEKTLQAPGPRQGADPRRGVWGLPLGFRHG